MLVEFTFIKCQLLSDQLWIPGNETTLTATPRQLDNPDFILFVASEDVGVVEAPFVAGVVGEEGGRGAVHVVVDVEAGVVLVVLAAGLLPVHALGDQRGHAVFGQDVEGRHHVPDLLQQFDALFARVALLARQFVHVHH